MAAVLRAETRFGRPGEDNSAAKIQSVLDSQPAARRRVAPWVCRSKRAVERAADDELQSMAEMYPELLESSALGNPASFSSPDRYCASD